MSNRNFLRGGVTYAVYALWLIIISELNWVQEHLKLKDKGVVIAFNGNI